MVQAGPSSLGTELATALAKEAFDEPSLVAAFTEPTAEVAAAAAAAANLALARSASSFEFQLKF